MSRRRILSLNCPADGRQGPATLWLPQSWSLFVLRGIGFPFIDRGTIAATVLEAIANACADHSGGTLSTLPAVAVSKDISVSDFIATLVGADVIGRTIRGKVRRPRHNIQPHDTTLPNFEFHGELAQ